VTSPSSKKWLVPYNDLRPQLLHERREILSAVERVLLSGSLVMGQECEAFEQELAKKYGYKRAVGVASGTDALELALRCFARGGDVLTVANSAPATVAAIIRAGCKPVFCEVDVRGLMNPKLLGHFLTKDTKAIVPVDLYGQWCDRRAIVEFAKQHKLRVIEDAAQAYGSGHFPADLPDAMCFSFYPTKALGALGDGGAVLTNDPDAETNMRELRFYGIADRKSLFQIQMGFNSRLDEVQAAILRGRAMHVLEARAQRCGIAQRYDEDLPQAFLSHGYDCNLNYHIFDIHVPNRDWFQMKLRELGVDTTVHYPVPAHRQVPTEVKERVLPMTERFCATTLSLPCWSGMTDEQVQLVIDSVCEVAEVKEPKS